MHGEAPCSQILPFVIYNEAEIVLSLFLNFWNFKSRRSYKFVLINKTVYFIIKTFSKEHRGSNQVWDSILRFETFIMRADSKGSILGKTYIWVWEFEKIWIEIRKTNLGWNFKVLIKRFERRRKIPPLKEFYGVVTVRSIFIRHTELETAKKVFTTNFKLTKIACPWNWRLKGWIISLPVYCSFMIQKNKIWKPWYTRFFIWAWSCLRNLENEPKSYLVLWLIFTRFSQNNLFFIGKYQSEVGQFLRSCF